MVHFIQRQQSSSLGGYPNSHYRLCDSFINMCNDGELSGMMDDVRVVSASPFICLRNSCHASFQRNTTALSPDAEGIERERCLNSCGKMSQLRSTLTLLAPPQLHCSGSFPIRFASVLHLLQFMLHNNASHNTLIMSMLDGLNYGSLPSNLILMDLQSKQHVCHQTIAVRTCHT